MVRWGRVSPHSKDGGTLVLLVFDAVVGAIDYCS